MLQRIRRRLSPGSSPAAGDISPDDALPKWTQEAHALGLRDAYLSGFYRTAAGEVYSGVPVGPDDVVLDVGCGEGGALAYCAGMGARVIAVDHDPTTVAKAETLIRDRGTGEKDFLVASADALPLPDRTASRILCMEVLEHVADPRTVLSELARVGQPGALYLLTVPDPRGEAMLEVLGPQSYFEPPNHIRIIGRDEFEDLVTGAGLHVISHDYYGFYWLFWLALCWSRDVPTDGPQDDTLFYWAKTWAALLDSPGGPEVQRTMDRFMAKSQIIVARKPTE